MKFVLESQQYGLTTKRKWLKGNKKPERYASTLDQAKYDKNSLERADSQSYVIIDTKTNQLVEDVNIREAKAEIKGNSEHSALSGTIRFKQVGNQVKVIIDLQNLPKSKFLGFHIHAKGDCSGNDKDEFKNVGKHYNPSRTQHPEHAGDLTSIYSSNGRIHQEFETDKFTVDEILGKSVIIHSDRDDFKSQPAGDSGDKIACGVIMKDNNIQESIQDIEDTLTSIRDEYKKKLKKELLIDFFKTYDEQIQASRNLQELTPYIWEYFKDSGGYISKAFGEYTDFKQEIINKSSSLLGLDDKIVTRTNKPSGKVFTKAFVQANFDEMYDPNTNTFTIPATIKKLNSNALDALSDDQFLKIKKLDRFVIPEGIEDIPESFMNFVRHGKIVDITINNLILPRTLKNIGGWAFRGAAFKNKVIIPDGVEEIGQRFSANYTYGRKYKLVIELPSSLRYLDDDAFEGEHLPDHTYSFYDSLQIYYKGTKNQWEKLTYHFSDYIKKGIDKVVNFI